MPAVNTIASAPFSCEKITADPMPRAGDKNVQGELAFAFPCCTASLNVPNVIRDTAQTFQPGFFGKLTLGFFNADAERFTAYGKRSASRSPTRLFCGKPDCGLMPMLVPMATPFRIPVTLELPPK